tara:strand:+ start:61 stop:1095 length:1035 start_codon:yes stop_codon:yes gene_type:complete
MAINVNAVYKTVLLILNKEERGYVTPDEFNKISAQVQLEVFEQYSDDLNQQLRVPQSDTDYADRVSNIDERLAIFKTFGTATYDAATIPTNPYFTLPTTDIYGDTVEFYRLGAVVYKDTTELQRLQRMDFYNIQKSPLTKSTESFPTYLFENEKLFVKPDSITSNVGVNFLRKPLDPRWGYSVGSVGQFVYDPTVYGANLINTGTGTLTNSITTALTGGTAGTYNSVATTGGTGTGLIVNATVVSDTSVTIDVATAGTGYVSGDVVSIAAGLLGGTSTQVDITLTDTDFNANSTYGSTQIELDVSEQTDVILRTLFYFGVVVKDPQIIQVAASQVQRDEINEKS